MTTKLPSDKNLEFDYIISDGQYKITDIFYDNRNITRFVEDYCDGRIAEWEEELQRNLKH
jgi:hypothetical protein